MIASPRHGERDQHAREGLGLLEQSAATTRPRGEREAVPTVKGRRFSLTCRVPRGETENRTEDDAEGALQTARGPWCENRAGVTLTESAAGLWS